MLGSQSAIIVIEVIVFDTIIVTLINIFIVIVVVTAISFVTILTQIKTENFKKLEQSLNLITCTLIKWILIKWFEQYKIN